MNSILVLCKEEAERLSHPEVMPHHLLLGMIRDGENKAVDMLRGLGVDIFELKSRLESVPCEPVGSTAVKASIENMALSQTVTRLLKIGMLEARLM